ncbi:MAG: methionyl-tRNA formyltransferase [Candidatus Velthaea sp.]
MFGTSEFAVPSLQRLAARTEIVAVVTQPDRPAGRGHRLAATPVKAAALACGLPVHTPLRLRDLVPELTALRADIFAVASYGRILPAALLALPVAGIAFNVHPSLLPLYRGATPLQSAIRDGRRETGVTIIAMDAGMDTGDILVQERTPLDPGETYGELHDRLAARGAELLIAAIDRLAAGTLERTPQAQLGVPADEIAATLTHPIGRDDLMVDWSEPAARIVDTIRAFAPAPAARARVGGEIVKILAVRPAVDGEAGVTADAGFVERAGDGRGVVLLRVTPPNRGPMSGAAYARARGAAV